MKTVLIIWALVVITVMGMYVYINHYIDTHVAQALEVSSDTIPVTTNEGMQITIDVTQLQGGKSSW